MIEGTEPAAAPNICSVKTEQKGLPIGIARMVGLQTAATLLGGKRNLGDALGITERAVAHKISATRGVSDDDLIATASALDKLAARISAHAQKLRDVIAPPAA